MARIEQGDFEIFKVTDDICKDCLNWKDFKEKCWYFWERKSVCTQKIKL